MVVCEHLFVYGTLMSTSSDAMGVTARARLFREASRVDVAAVPGRLYDLGTYPGLVLDERADMLVQGELLKLLVPDRTFDWLDAYESIDPRPGAVNEYLRVVAPVSRSDGSRVGAWLYRYVLDAGRFPIIATGRWPENPVP